MTLRKFDDKGLFLKKQRAFSLLIVPHSFDRFCFCLTDGFSPFPFCGLANNFFIFLRPYR